jgi:hypothetical protein
MELRLQEILFGGHSGVDPNTKDEVLNLSMQR